MKRLVSTLSIIAVLGMISPSLPTLAQPIQIPHENPATATGSLDKAALLLSYSRIYNLAASRHYLGAQDILTELRQTDIPAELGYITDRCETLSREVLDNLNNTEFLLDEASTLLSHDQISDAKEKLDEAKRPIQDTQFLLQDIEAVTNILSDELGVFAAPATSQTRQAYDRLSSSLNRVRQLTNELNQIRENLNENPQTIITTSFYHLTFLELLAPETAYPGLPFTISGRVSSTVGNIDRTIKVLWDDTRLAEATASGQFSLEITPPEQAPTGQHSLTVAVTPQGRYAGASKTRSINISRVPIYIDAQTPTLALLPKIMQISGQVYHDLGPVPDARVSLNLKNSSSTARTSPDGSFTTSLEAPLDLSLARSQELTITVAPMEPWYTSLKVKRPLFTVNPLSTGLLLVFLIALGLLVYRRSQTRLREEKGIPRAEVIEPPAITPPPAPKPKLTGIKGRILSAYRVGLEAVEKVSGVGMTPNITLREFLKMATLLLPTAIKQFAELTSIAENTLYSAYSPRADNATRAEQLATNIKEELRRGTS